MAEEDALALPNGEIQDLDRRIARFEQKTGMDSATMRAKLYDGEIDETEQICNWLMLLEERRYLRSLLARE